MPGGIGPVPPACTRGPAAGDIDLPADASPTWIFYHLGVGRAHYVAQRRTLYFVESPALSVRRMIERACAGMAARPVAQQLFIDRHGFIRGAHAVVLEADRADRILVALRLQGLQISIAGPPRPRAPGAP